MWRRTQPNPARDFPQTFRPELFQRSGRTPPVWPATCAFTVNAMNVWPQCGGSGGSGGLLYRHKVLLCCTNCTESVAFLHVFLSVPFFGTSHFRFCYYFARFLFGKSPPVAEDLFIRRVFGSLICDVAFFHPGVNAVQNSVPVCIYVPRLRPGRSFLSGSEFSVWWNDEQDDFLNVADPNIKRKVRSKLLPATVGVSLAPEWRRGSVTGR